MGEREGTSLVPAIILIALFGALLAGWWLFPRFQAYMAVQDCIATGRTNCTAS